MLIVSLVLFGLLTSIHFSDALAKEGLRLLRRSGILPWPPVEFSGLLDDLYTKWPLDEDEVRPSTLGLANLTATQPRCRPLPLFSEKPNAGTPERRGAKRYRDLCLPADNELRVSHGEEVHWALLVDISSTGARLGQPKQPLPDTMLTLSYLHLRIPARVVWSNAGQTGVHFVMPLGGSDLSVLGCESSHVTAG